MITKSWTGGLLLALILITRPCSAAETERAEAAAARPEAAQAATGTDKRLVRNGVVIDFQIVPVGAPAAQGTVMADQLAEARFRVTDEATGKPLRGVKPGAWIDMGVVLQGKPTDQQKGCKDKVSLYMQGAVGIRPMIDLNNYNLVVMNAEPSLSVVDPLVSMAGKTSTLAQIPLPSPGADWAVSADQKRLYVSAPRSGKLVVVDAESFKVAAQIAAGKQPIRVALQPDGKYLWIGNDAAEKASSGVTVIDTETDKVVASIATGGGHHEIAFSGDSRHAFVTNRDEGTVSVFDVATRKRLKDIKIGRLPISVAYSPQADAVYVADGRDGTVLAIDAKTFETRARITLQPGLGPLRFDRDGRYGMVVNPGEDTVSVIDAASNELINTVEIKGEPYQIVFSNTFAYVRALRSERVSLITLASLGKGRNPAVQSFPAGGDAPKAGGQLAIADSMTAASTEGTFFVVNPADNTTYYYMEGMNSPSSNYQIRGGSARAVTLVDRSLREVEPGVYAAKVKLPAPGHYDVAFLMQTPQILHCFAADATANPATAVSGATLTVEFDETQRSVTAGETLRLRFTLKNPTTGQPRSGIGDVRVMYFLAPNHTRTEVAAREVGEGRYEADLPLRTSGGYYVYVSIPSMNLDFDRLPHFTLRARDGAPPPPPTGTKG